MGDGEDWAAARVAELHASGETGAAVGFLRKQTGFHPLGPFHPTGLIEPVVVRADGTIERPVVPRVLRSIHECCVIAMATVAELRPEEGSKGGKIECECGRIWESRDRGRAGWAWYIRSRTGACTFGDHASCEAGAEGCGCSCHDADKTVSP